MTQVQTLHARCSGLTQMAFNKQVHYSFIWIITTPDRSAAKSLPWHSAASSIDSIWVALKGNPGQISNGMSSVFWLLKLRRILFETPDQSKRLQKGSEYLRPDRWWVWSWWMWWAALCMFQSYLAVRWSFHCIYLLCDTVCNKIASEILLRKIHIAVIWICVHLTQ